MPAYIRASFVLAALFALFVLGRAANAAEDFLEPEAAFRFSAKMVDGGTAAVTFHIADGYYMYRERFKFAASAATLGQPRFPRGKVKYDSTFQKEMEIYRGEVTVLLPVQASGTFKLAATSQGCSDSGLCYMPQESSITLTGKASTGEPDRIGAALAEGRLWVIAPLFLVLGLGLAFTPCVLPMLPILSSIIVGEGTASRKRGLLLSASYSLGMAIVYTALGITAGLIGEGLAAFLQNPWTLGGFALLLTLLALSMFGLYELQVPAALQGRLAGVANRQASGKLAGVFAMGMVSALIVGPCVAAPLAGALLYISQTGNVLIGGSALFAMAAGMSVPLLLLGVSAGSLLPRSGAWMGKVKKFFGVLLLATAAWLVAPVLPGLRTEAAGTQFTRIRTVQELDAALGRTGGRPVMLDFYADWCVSCKEMEKLTFSQPQVKARLKDLTLLQVDVTANGPDERALMKRFGLFGPPAIILFDGQGREIAGARIIGFQNAPDFLRSLERTANGLLHL
ncbi:protein-disulfide reductase DsbD [Massilia endophytica]|uniref:protein-disulfide reductase DsbD n=1 Tax=Massilia endophytica TaxID=2899220 RepID=UPI001E508D29|nr:protein-disulfide reductase DsbD [Massilia endophytica]UGQ46231.1 protein-disulfide reductase DsbD [Massilia endophytica]